MISSIKTYFSKYKLHNWVGLLGMCIFTITLAFAIRNFVTYASSPNSSWKIFFGIFDRFTWQSNLLLTFYMFLYIWKPDHQFFKNNKFLICTMVYVFFTFVGYNVVLVGISGDRAYVGNALEVCINVWVHILAPLYFIFYGYVYMFENVKKEPEKFVRLLLTGMIYPMIYAIYLITIPYTFKDYRENPDAYGLLPTDKNYGLAYSVYGNSTNTFNNNTSYAYILVMLLGFFPGSFCLFYYSWKGMNKLFGNKQYNTK